MLCSVECKKRLRETWEERGPETIQVRGRGGGDGGGQGEDGQRRERKRLKDDVSEHEGGNDVHKRYSARGLYDSQNFSQTSSVECNEIR